MKLSKISNFCPGTFCLNLLEKKNRTFLKIKISLEMIFLIKEGLAEGIENESIFSIS